jgi:2,3-bisphosphoglycerate-independent phosphoglycerate mutase
MQHPGAAIRTPAALIVLDGWGWREDSTHNAIAQADTPFFDHLLATYPHAVFAASGPSVGLPEGQMGNSEIGHMSIGAGIPIDTDLVRINKAIDTDCFATTPAWEQVFSHVATTGGTLHVLGLLSDGGIHSHERHMHAFLSAAHDAGVKRVLVHAFLDGRDAPPQSGAGYLRTLEDLCATLGVGRIASVCGRYYAMDRDNNWDRVDRALLAVCDGVADGTLSRGRASDLVTSRYADTVVDEHFEPAVMVDASNAPHAIVPGDAVVMLNFRADRARMLARRLTERYGSTETNVPIVTLTEYDSTLPVTVAFPPLRPTVTLAGVLARAGLTQTHIAETEKYAHATYFLNGGREEPHDGEEHVLIESRKDVRTHDEAPDMRAREIADAAVARLRDGVDFLFINFANADMVGHTANVPAIMQAVEAIDRELQRIVDAVHERGGFVFITADHGNAEQNFDDTSQVRHTAHTLNHVPAILTDARYSLTDGALPDVAPTVLSLMGLPVPDEMTGTVRAAFTQSNTSV